MSAAGAVAAINAEVHDDGTRAYYYNTYNQPQQLPSIIPPTYHQPFQSFPVAGGSSNINHNHDGIPSMMPYLPTVPDPVPHAVPPPMQSAASVPASVPASNQASASVPAPVATEPARQSKKRAKPQSSDDEEREEADKKRPRGRPRLDSKDESAAERRRTQIRNAQRAYRSRKETTIATLENENDTLRNSNDTMAMAFRQLRAYATARGILDHDAGFARVLQSASQKFLDLAAQQEDRELDVIAGEQQPETSAQSRDKGKGKASASSERARGPAYPPAASSSAAAPRVYRSSTTILNSARAADWSVGTENPFPYKEAVYEVITEPTFDNASFFSNQPMTSPTQRLTNVTTEEADDDADIEFVPTPHRWGWDVWKKLPTPIGYAHHELTFGRRLHRAGCELGLSLVGDPNPPPHIYAAVFGFCLLFESREQILARLKEMLARPSDETLNNWKVPFNRLGGAGTHGLEKGIGAKQGPYGNQGYRDDLRPAHETGYSMGPLTSVIEEARQTRLDCRMRMLLPGFQGDFFDPEDVELYLRNRGVNIPGDADYVEANIKVEDFTEGDVPPQSTPYEDDRIPRLTEMYDQSVTGALYMLHGPSIVSTEPTGWVAGKPKEKIPEFESYNQKKRVMINVGLLINEINFRSVCLGRAPGTRPRDINVAFWRSVTVH